MIDVNKIVDQCYDRLPNEWKSHPWDLTDHGRKVLQTEFDLDGYLAAYGEMHIVKCRAALQNFPCEEENDIQRHNFEIFDWGCGQGIATLTLLEFLEERKLLWRLNAITLIEPSEIALKRAQQWVCQHAGPAVKVKVVCKYIPSDIQETLDEVSCSSYVSINLFSNILDIKSVNLLWLARKTSSIANINYMICVGPKFTENTRIQDFCGYLNPSSYFSSIDAKVYTYTQRTHHPYGCETRCFVCTRDEDVNCNYVEKATDIGITDDYDYSIECLRGSVDEDTLYFYNKIKNECSNTYTVFIRPAIGVDMPDVVLASMSKGIIIFNVCQDVNYLEKDNKRVENIKEFLFNTHLKSIKVDSIINPSVYGSVKTGIYFPNSTQSEVEDAIRQLNEKLNKDNSENDIESTEKDHFAYLVKSFPSDDFKVTLNRLTSRGFRSDYYNELVKIITGNWHSYRDGDTNFRLTPKQRELVRSNNNRLRVKGVAGCGKTQVVANRAVECHLRTGRKVLILTFNISLIQYVRMRINQVPADFSTNMFEITNYHQFFISMANKYSGKKPSITDFDNESFFEPYKNKIERYDSIVIDEVQDFETTWLSSIIYYFLAPNGTISVFGDGEQNIYNRKMAEEKMPSIPTFSGPWNKINERISMRILNPAIAHLAYHFAKKYVDSSTLALNIPNELIFEEYFVKYWNIGQNTTARILSQNIRWIEEHYHLDFKDIVVLSESINILRNIEKELNNNHLSCTTNFETDKQYQDLTSQDDSEFFRKNLEEIRRVAKTHFTTDTQTIKLSTIHSFKGWESKSVILIIQPEMQGEISHDNYCIKERKNTPALIYTALTRAKCNLFIINLGNPRYDDFFLANVV